MIADIRLLRDECLIRLEQPERLSASRVMFIPSGAGRLAHELYEAVVIGVGPGIRRRDGTVRPVACRPGERVICYWPTFEMPALPEYGEGCRIIREGLIQAIIEE